jgi:hypothetical protein
MDHAQAYFRCSGCRTKFQLCETLLAPSPFDEDIEIEACPGCQRIIDNDPERVSLVLTCSRDGCHAQPIGSDGNGWWCSDHQEP